MYGGVVCFARSYYSKVLEWTEGGSLLVFNCKRGANQVTGNKTQTNKGTPFLSEGVADFDDSDSDPMQSRRLE